MSETLTITVKGASRAECLTIARTIAVDAFTVDGEIQPFTEGSVQLKQSAQGGLEDERFWAGEVTYFSQPSPPFGFSPSPPVEQEAQSIHLPGVDTTGLTVGGEALDEIVTRLETPVVEGPIVVAPPGKELL